MLIASTPPPIPTSLSDNGALCPTGTGMGFEPLSMLTSVLTPISNFFVAKEQSKTAKKALALEASKLKSERDQEARDFAYQKALSQADALAEPSEQKRKEQMIVLTAVGGAAVVISALFILGSIKAGRE